MLTNKMGGIFDCRAYDQSGKLAHDQRRMLADTDNVTFSALIPLNQVPDMFKKKPGTDTSALDMEAVVRGDIFDDFVKPKSSRAEREKAKAENREPVCDVVSVKFKIGANCKWFDKFAKACVRPTNAELEENRWNVQLDFTRKAKDPSSPLKPAGYWVNAIMVSKIEANPFSGQAFETSDDDEEPEPEAATMQPATNQPAAPQVQTPGEAKEGDDLPF